MLNLNYLEKRTCFIFSARQYLFLIFKPHHTHLQSAKTPASRASSSILTIMSAETRGDGTTRNLAREFKRAYLSSYNLAQTGLWATVLALTLSALLSNVHDYGGVWAAAGPAAKLAVGECGAPWSVDPSWREQVDSLAPDEFFGRWLIK